MTKQRSQYIYELIGRVNEKRQRTSKGEEYKGQKYYELLINCENKPQVNKLFAYQSKIETEKIWQDILNSNYIDKRYLFYCKNYMGNYRIINWKELNKQESHGSN